MPNDRADPDIRLAMNLIDAYLLDHCTAADTAEGIAQWWLGAAGAAISPKALRIALMRLVRAGRLRTRRLPGGDTLWYAPGGADE